MVRRTAQKGLQFLVSHFAGFAHIGVLTQIQGNVAHREIESANKLNMVKMTGLQRPKRTPHLNNWFMNQLWQGKRHMPGVRRCQR